MKKRVVYGLIIGGSLLAGNSIVRLQNYIKDPNKREKIIIGAYGASQGLTACGAIRLGNLSTRKNKLEGRVR